MKRFFVFLLVPMLALVACFTFFRFGEVKDLFINFYTSFSWEMVMSVAIAGAVTGYTLRQWMLKSKQERRRRAEEEEEE